jgi:hypothetical protein
MKMQQLKKSGLLVPKQKPQPAQKLHGSGQIQDDAKRELAVEGLLKLWDAMDLSHSGGIVLPENGPSADMSKVYNQTYRFLGTMLLGKDCPEREILT